MGRSSREEMNRSYGKIRSFLYSASLLAGCLLLTTSLFLVSFSDNENDKYSIYFNIGKDMLLLKYDESGAATVEKEVHWNYERADSAYQLPPIPKELIGYGGTKYRFMVMYLEGKTYMTVYNGIWGRYFGDYNYTFYHGTHTWEFSSSKNKWIDAPANIQLPLLTKEN
jgi:hypothetical protein